MNNYNYELSQAILHLTGHVMSTYLIRLDKKI